MPKKYTAFLAALTMLFSAVSCGMDTPLTSHHDADGSAAAEDLDNSDEENDEPAEQSCHKTIENSEKPEVTMITLSGVCKGNIKKLARVEDLYNADYLHSGVVGLVGIPVELILYEEKGTIDNMKLTFTYNPDELRGIPEKNLIFLKYNEFSDFYDEIYGDVDEENNTVSIDADGGGVYMLVDAYQWLKCWGVDVSEYEYEVAKSQYQTDWERECPKGSIMEIADKKWAVENAPDFRVSTPEQLAGVVYYVNGLAENSEVTVVIESDIDLSGYEWVPMGWRKNGFHGTVDGGGHTISNMKISGGYGDSGFIGYSCGSADVKDISFVNAEVHGTNCTGIVGGEIYSMNDWSGIHLSNCTVYGGNNDTAAIVGRETDITFKDCTVENVTVNGEDCKYYSYRQKILDETEIVETFTLTLNDDYTITRDDHEGFHNLRWHIHRNGKRVLGRGAEDFDTKEPELVLHTHDLIGYSAGDYEVYLVAYINGTYVRVSNIIDYTLCGEGEENA